MEVTTLTWYESRLAAIVGIDRHINAVKLNRRDRHGFNGGQALSIQQHIDGAAGELAFAKAAEIYWPATIDTFWQADLGVNIQVRTRSKPDFELIVRDGDSDKDLFVLVTGTIPNFNVVGWIKGIDAKNPAWKVGHGGREPAFFVPQEKLMPIANIKETA